MLAASGNSGAFPTQGGDGGRPAAQIVMSSAARGDELFMIPHARHRRVLVSLAGRPRMETDRQIGAPSAPLDRIAQVVAGPDHDSRVTNLDWQMLAHI